MRLAILGGTGKEGKGLALAWARAGRTIFLGSRDEEKGRRVARELEPGVGRGLVSGGSNREAARVGDVVVSTLPHEGQAALLRELREELRGKILITATIAWPPGLSGRPSAAEEAQRALGDAGRVVAAFQTVSAGRLRRLGTANHGDGGEAEDVLVFSNDDDALEETRRLVDETGLRGVKGGKLENARVAEALTGLLLAVNRSYGVKSAGVRITGLPRPEKRAGA